MITLLSTLLLPMATAQEIVFSENCFPIAEQAEKCHNTLLLCKDAYLDAEEDIKKYKIISENTLSELDKSIAREKELGKEVAAWYRNPATTTPIAIVFGIVLGTLVTK